MRDRFKAFLCVDCKVNTEHIGEYYTLRDWVWRATGMRLDGGMLCIGCVETRLGRTLHADDFTDAPVNDGTFWPHSERLRNRIGRSNVNAETSSDFRSGWHAGSYR